MKNLVLIFVVPLLFLSSGCKKQNTTEPGNGAFILEEIDDVLSNPFKGFVPWIGENNPLYDTKLQYGNFAWKDLEPTQGDYNWSKLEHGWGNIAATGKRVGFRISAAIPGDPGHIDIPGWLADQGIRMRAYQIDDAEGLAPDWDDPRFLQAHQSFITALGNRYNNDPRVAWIDIGSYGFWGEWHVYLNDSLAATQTSKQAILDHYFSAFPTKMKVIAFDDDFATKYVTDRNCGIRNDCLGTQESNDWYLESLNRIDPNLNNRVWKYAIITGEFCGSNWGATQGTTIRFDLNYQFIQQTHWSFIGPAGGSIIPQDEEHRKNLDQIHKKLGYRFILRKFEHTASMAPGLNLPVTITIENKGIAPFYFQWPLVCYLVNQNGETSYRQTLDIDIRQWLPGVLNSTATLHLPQDLTRGLYNIKLAIHDPQIDKPAVMFANTNRDDEGRYLVSKLRVQ